MKKAERGQQENAMRSKEWYLRDVEEWRQEAFEEELDMSEIEEGWDSVQRKIGWTVV
jgi:hypothetical protein